ncbi:MAG: magnesium transporter CorA family protein [Clostridia bacterium]|nr:magnesium transporter CorA family protein [Clostridia bacterium]
MLQIFQTTNSMLKELQTEFSGGINLKNCWIHLTNPTDKESELIIRTTGIPEDMLKAALDEEERARIEYDDGCTLVLFDIPIIEEESSYFSYSTMPLAAIMTKDCLVTVCLKENSIIHQFINGRIKNLDTLKRERFLYMLLYSAHIKFLQYLKQIDKSSQRIQLELHRSTKNKELIQLLDLENSLVYFSTSLRANGIIIEKLIRMDNKKVEEDTELLEDVAIENRQAIEMSNIYREILSGTMDAYASVISNNLNIIMKVLTTLTVILAVPTLTASYWGMNTGVPFEGKLWGFWVVFGISMVLTGICAFFIMRGKTTRPRK